MDFGNVLGNLMNPYGSKVVGTATWSCTLITSATYAALSTKWKIQPHKPGLRKYGTPSTFIQNPVIRLPKRLVAGLAAVGTVVVVPVR